VAASDGEVQIRQADLTGVTSMAASEGSLIIASADRGLLCIELSTFSPRWVRATKPYVVSTVQVDQHTVYVTQTRGAFLALGLADGRERGRLQTEHGFLAAPSMRDGRGFILGNSGVLYAFDY
jgi:outer membrane protein assembly factor BamB